MNPFDGRVVVLVTALALAGSDRGVLARDGPGTDGGGSALPADYSCSQCHKKDGNLWSEGMPVVDEHGLDRDIHWQKGLLCHDCHGGSPTLDEFKDHRNDPTFRTVRSRGYLLQAGDGTE